MHYVCIDWPHLGQLTAVCDRHYETQINLVVWAKSNAGMGGLYRSQHELIPVFRKGKVAHINNVALGKHGRNRPNVWRHEGANSINAARREELALHPTVKPAALVADAILDCTRRGDIILDPFIGSGTLFIACEKTGRVGYGIELDPLYVDVAVRRWQTFTGHSAVHAVSGQSFNDMTASRLETYSADDVPNPEGGHHG